MAAVFVGLIPSASVADAIAVHLGRVTLVGTLYTDATRHIYLRLDQPITVSSNLPSNRGPEAMVNQQEVDVAAIVTDRPINGVRVSLTGELQPGVPDSRSLRLVVESKRNLP